MWGGETFIVFFAAVAIAGFITVYFVRRSKRRSGKPKAGRPDSRADALSSRPNSICLFGDFSVRDRNNTDITYMFPARQIQILCLIFCFNDDGGISTRKLSAILWPDKSEDKVKNSRGVAMNHLRKTLSLLEGVEIVHESGCYKLIFGQQFYCDYIEAMNIMKSASTDKDMDALIDILLKGKFLRFLDDIVFDSFKSDVEGRIDSLMQVEIQKRFEEKDYLRVIDISEIIFMTDPFSDMALSYYVRAMRKIRRAEDAFVRYRTFVSDYRKTYDTDYPHPFNSL